MKRLAVFVALVLAFSAPSASAWMGLNVAASATPTVGPPQSNVTQHWTVANWQPDVEQYAESGSVVAVMNRQESTVKVYTTSGDFVGILANPGRCPVQVQDPVAMAVVSNRVYVCDGATPRIQVYDLTEFTHVREWPFPGDTPTNVCADGEQLYVEMASGASGVYNPANGHLAWTPAPEPTVTARNGN